MSRYPLSIDVTRPANTTPYTAGDVVGGLITFPRVSAVGELLVATAVQLLAALSAVPPGMSSFRLHLYNEPPPSDIADNAAFTIPAGDRGMYLGYVVVPIGELFGSSVYAQEVCRQFVELAPADNRVFAYLVTDGAYTPAATSEVYTLSLWVDPHK